eukprot:CAMPEP_0171673760 /NCGR_PEP_ID=MMETSP0990-20121206/52803_1 /TAXON_ID=483369 /ORGANISM="non described non described, Strain CCMP2098" /LENGTH=33 /DNA_ID= /DNA_START= /DNA_END= /DNA_ORIENTATION=
MTFAGLKGAFLSALLLRRFCFFGFVIPSSTDGR